MTNDLADDVLVRALRLFERTSGDQLSSVEERENANVLKHLADVLQADERASDFVGIKFRANGTGAGRLSVDELCRWATRRTADVGAEQTVRELTMYSSSRTFPCRFTIGIRGVATSERVDLSDHIALGPPSKDLVGFGRRDHATEETTACLDVTVPYPRLVSTNIDDTSLSRDTNEKKSAHDRLTVARLCIAIAAESHVLETVRTATATEAVPGYDGSAGARTYAIPAGIRVITIDASLLGKVRWLHNRLIDIPATMRGRLVVAMQRWQNSYLHDEITPDLFIDVGIGLECVFVPEESTELKHRLAVRGARLLGGATPDSRQAMGKLLETLYDARSRAVHKGQLLPRIKPGLAENVEHLAMVGPAILRNAILALAERGRDDWDELIYA